MNNKWLRVKNELPDAEMRVFCLPYAGAGATMYIRWPKYFGKNIEICPIQLPGRENRMQELLIDDIGILIPEIYEGIKHKLDKKFCIFGHSMGGIIAYELTKFIEKKEGILPEYLFMSATGLNIKKSDMIIHKLEKNDFIEFLINSGGTERELAENKEFQEYYLPIIKNDYKLVENYIPNEEKLKCSIRAFGSKNDTQVDIKETEKLERCTDDFNITYFEGNHFFIREHEKEICDIISKMIDKGKNNE